MVVKLWPSELSASEQSGPQIRCLSTGLGCRGGGYVCKPRASYVYFGVLWSEGFNVGKKLLYTPIIKISPDLDGKSGCKWAFSVKASTEKWWLLLSHTTHAPFLLTNRPFAMFSFEKDSSFGESFQAPSCPGRKKDKQAYHRLLVICLFVEQIVNSPQLKRLHWEGGRIY